MKKRVLLLLVSFCTTTFVAMAGGNSTYYFKTNVSAAPSGAGTVYANTTNADGTHQPSISLDLGSQSASNTPTKDIYLWATANSGYTFIGWEGYGVSFSGNVATIEGNKSEAFITKIKANFINSPKVFQIENSDFEKWDKYGDDDHAPDNWNSFETCKPNGALTEMAKAQQVDRATDVRPLSLGSYSARIYSRNVMVANAQGNLTTGRINAGSTTPANPDNHNFTDVTNGAFNQYFGAHPDAVKVWVKFVPDNTSYTARVAFTTHDAYNYITYGQESDNNATNESHAYSHAALNFQATSDKGWQQLFIPFTLTGNTVEPTYIVANFSTNSTPGGGSSDDQLYIDDMELVYNSEISSATYQGAAVSFTDGAATVEAAYDETKLSVTTTSLANVATVEKNYNESTSKLTITVKGEDISVNPSNFHTYTIQFKKPLTKGDVNGDGQVTIADVTALVNIILGKSEDELGMANVNGDESVTIADVTALVNIILGK